MESSPRVCEKKIRVAWVQEAEFLPFSEAADIAFLGSQGIVFTRNIWKAEVLLMLSGGTRRSRILRKILFWKRWLVWTNEPRFDATLPGSSSTRLKVMNVFSGDVFWHNLHFLGSYHHLNQVDLGIDLETTRPPILTEADLALKAGFCISIFGWCDPRGVELKINGTNIDLNARRQALALSLYRKKLGAIVGSGWPAEVAVVEQSDFENSQAKWWTRKLDLLRNYRFNLCFENTAWPFYCTEKIWHAVAAGCLPIYWSGGTRIYDTFPKKSFVDASNFATDDALIDFLEKMTLAEYLARYELCRQAFISACAQRLALPEWRMEIVNKFAAGVRALVD